jgi:hypothetical protein
VINDVNATAALTAHLNNAAVVWDLPHSIKASLTRGVDAASLSVILPADCVSAAVEDDAAAGYKHLSKRFTAAGTTRQNQAKLTELLHKILGAEYQVAFDELPKSAAARAAGCESRDEAKARH